MNTLDIRDACRDDYAEIAQLIAEQNREPEISNQYFAPRRRK